MIISNIKLRNWRNFESVDVDLERRVFLVGPNACGKSNFLDAIRFLRDIAKTGGGLQASVDERIDLSRIRCLAARRDPTVEIEVGLSQPNTHERTKWKYGIGISQETGSHRKPKLKYERVWRDDELILDRPDKSDSQDPKRLTETHLEYSGTNEKFRAIAEFLESISYKHLVPQFLRHPHLFAGPNIKEDSYGLNFLDAVAKTHKKTQKARLKKIGNALKIAVPQLENLSHIKDELGVSHLEAVYTHWRSKGAKQSEVEFSDGTLRLIGLLWSLMESDSLLLLEEPELSLHTGIIRQLPGLIWRILKKKKGQVIISTHSADLLSDPGIGGEEVLMLIPSSEGTRVQKASNDREVRELLASGLSIADVVIPKTQPEEIERLSQQPDLFSK
jgi:predicted ATPase